MISDHDRSGWFGASDTATIMGNWKTKTFGKWWLQKLGLDNSHFTNTAMNAGTYYEHTILDYIKAPRKDHQIILPGLLLRVNLDGDDPASGNIWEVKTHSDSKEFKVSKAYWQQVQVQMWAKSQVERVVPYAEIVAYGLTEEDYRNFFNPIDPVRLKRYPVGYDAGFIERYLVRLKCLKECLERGAWPDENAC